MHSGFGVGFECLQGKWLTPVGIALSPMDDSGAGAFEEGGSASASPNLDSSMINSKGKRASNVFKKGDEVKSASKNKGRKRQAEDGRMVLVGRPRFLDVSCCA